MALEMPNMDKTLETMIEKIEAAVAENKTLKWSSKVVCNMLRSCNVLNDYEFKGWFNRLIFALSAMQHGDPRFLRREAAFSREMNNAGARVRKGGKLVWVYQPVFLDIIDSALCARLGIDYEYAKKHKDDYVKNASNSPRIYKLSGFKQIAFFNVKDMTGFLGNVKNNKGEVIPEKLGNPENKPIQVAEDFFGKLGLVIGFDPQPHYEPPTDKIGMPKLEHFESSEAYYSTLAHEVIHWSGAAERCNRDGVTNIIDKSKSDYSREELIACLGSVFLMMSLGLEVTESHLDNETAYLANWIKPLKNEPKMIFEAASEAERAIKWLFSIAAVTGAATVTTEKESEETMMVA